VQTLTQRQLLLTLKHTPNGIELSPFQKLPKAATKALADEAAGLDAMHR
jgi:hypothetical protein